jgi:hypothetical protein
MTIRADSRRRHTRELRVARGKPCESLPRRVLLGSLLGVALPHASLLAVDDCRTRERALVWRTVHLDHRVGDARPPAGRLFLQHRLVVDVACQRVLDLLAERVEDRSADCLEAVLEIERAEGRLDQRRDDILVLRELYELVVGDRPTPVCEKSVTESETPAYDGTALARDNVRADLCEVPFLVVGKALVELTGDREAQDAVTEKLEPFVRLRAV